jgi:ATP-binding cassette subfamily A (ABC1) protein 3
MSIAFSIVIAGIARYIVEEKSSGLKHLQVISGMQLKAYWIGCFLFDLAKFYISIITALILFSAFQLDMNATMVPLVLLPFGALPFTYFFSFIITAKSVASSLTMFLNIVILGIVASVVFTFRLAIPDYMDTGD